jgi:vacuolar-type H+-ATPase subunit H
MREVIQKVIQAEGEAKRLRQEAQAEADRIMTEAQKQAHDLVVRCRQEVRVEAERIMAAAIQEAEREKKESLDRAAAEIEAQVRLDEATKQRAVEAVVRFVCGNS